MCATHHNLWASVGAAHLYEICLEAGVRFKVLKRYLLGTRQQCFYATEVEQCETAVALLDDAGYNVAFSPGVFLVFVDVDDLADSLAHHLAEGLGGDATEFIIFGRVVKLFAYGKAVFV